MNNYAKKETWNNIWNQKDRINNDDNDIKDSAFFFFINLSHLCIRRFIHFSYASIYLCIVYTLLLLVVHWRLHSPQLQTILHRFNSPHSLNLHIPSYLPANNVTTVRSTIVSYTNDTRVYRLSITIALFTIVERITGARSIETFQRSCNIREKRRKRDRKRWKTSFFPSISSRISSFSLVLLPSFHSFSPSGLTNARVSSLCFERTIRSLVPVRPKSRHKRLYKRTTNGTLAIEENKGERLSSGDEEKAS